MHATSGFDMENRWRHAEQLALVCPSAAPADQGLHMVTARCRGRLHSLRKAAGGLPRAARACSPARRSCPTRCRPASSVSVADGWPCTGSNARACTPHSALYWARSAAVSQNDDVERTTAVPMQSSSSAAAGIARKQYDIGSPVRSDLSCASARCVRTWCCA